jgi:hypothetical protein
MSLTHVDPHVSEIVMVWIQSGDLLMVWIQISQFDIIWPKKLSHQTYDVGRPIPYVKICQTLHNHDIHLPKSNDAQFYLIWLRLGDQ